MSTNNPFSNSERQHFPEFSPMFKKSSSNETSNGFRWSIDNIARLKPAEIATDPATLVQTNGHSPHDDQDAQKAVDTFFSQKVILPSPWPVSRHMPHPPQGDSPGVTRPPSSSQKKVTFSPHPPSTAFIQMDSLVESDMRDSRTVDTGTQTVLSLPMTFDLEKLVMEACEGVRTVHSEDVNECEARDVGNCSLRRKLFGQPDRQDSISPTQEPVEKMQLSDVSPWALDSTESSGDAVLIHVTEATYGGSKEEHNPAFSSLVLKSPGRDLLPDLSPIGCDQTSSTKGELAPTRLIPNLSPINVVPVTPKNKNVLLDDGHSQPVMEGVQPPGAKEGSTCTSTPNTAVTKRQLIASPFASPVLKHPCTSRSDFTDPKLLSHDHDEGKKSSDDEQLGDNLSQELPEPLSLEDLRTESLDLTNITATSCTGFFTNLGITDHSQVPMETQGHTHLRRPNVMAQPKAHSTMVDSQLKLNYQNQNLSHQTPAWLSAIPAVSHSNTAGTDSSSAIAMFPYNIMNVDSNSAVPMSHSTDVNVDSGVAGSMNYPQNDNLSNSRLERESIKSLTSSCEGPIVIPTADKQAGLNVLQTPTHRKKPDAVQEVISNSNVRRAAVDSGLVFSPDNPFDRGWSNKGTAFHQNHTPFSVLRGSQNHFTTQSVLPSRLRVPSPSSLLPRANHSPGHFTFHSPTLHDTPPSRYTKFGVMAPCHVTPVSAIPEEMLRKKKALKARLQFNSAGSVCHRETLKDITTLQTRVPSRPVLISCPRSPLANQAYSPFTHNLLSPIRSSFLSNVTTPQSPLHQYSPLHKENIQAPWRTHT